jgi:hypothetical protein
MMNLVNYRRGLFLVTLFVAACGGGDSAGTLPAGWLRQSENPIIVPTKVAATLDFGFADPSVMFDATDNKWKVWFSSTIQVSNIKTITLRYAESSDGVLWSSPITVFQVASDPAAWDYTHVETPAVIKNPDPAATDKKFMLWYAGANTTLNAGLNRTLNQPYYQIGLAYSADGKSFTRYSPGLTNKPGLVLVANAGIFGSLPPGSIFTDGTVADPAVLYKDNTFHMWFSSWATGTIDTNPSDLAFGVSHLTSTDGITWNNTHPNPLNSLFKAGEVAGGRDPSVLFNPTTQQFDMWFSNDTKLVEDSIPCHFNTVKGFWHATSSDAVNWIPQYSQYDLEYNPIYRYEQYGFLRGIDVILVGGRFRAFYSAFGSEANPDTSIYQCPALNGTLFPAVLTLNRATYISP